MDITKLVFFDRNGENMNLELDGLPGSPDGQLWKGRVHFGQLSIALFSNENVFVLEDVGGVHCFPQADPGDSFEFTWAEDDVPEVFLYDIRVDAEAELPYINRLDSYSVEMTADFVGLRAPLEFYVAFNPTWESSFSKTLNVWHVSGQARTKIAEVGFYGEGLEEDERFATHLSNFGIKFNKEDALMLSDYDIKEAMPDWDRINTKRKELIVNREEIFPYIGTYRGLVNMIGILGFRDVLDVKEYWLNIDKDSPYFDRMLLVDVTDQLDDGKIDSINMISLNRSVKFNAAFRKTGYLALAYQFTRESGEYDEDGLPVIESTTDFTADEIFYKLRMVRRMLQDEFLPTNVVIRDIIGEFVYIDSYVIKMWRDETFGREDQIGEDVGISCYPDSLYVRDIAPLYRKKFANGAGFPAVTYNNTTTDPFENYQRYPVDNMVGLVDAIESYYDSIASTAVDAVESAPGWEYSDDLLRPVGCPVVLTLDVAKLRIADLDGIRWIDMITNKSSPTEQYFTWENIKFRNMYEVEWIIEKKSPNPYNFRHRGPVLKMQRLAHILPYTGTYTVSVRCHDFFGGVSMKIDALNIVVYDTSVDVVAIAKIGDKFNYMISNMGNVRVEDFGASKWYDYNVNVLDNSNIDFDVNPRLLDWDYYSNYMANAKILNSSAIIPGPSPGSNPEPEEAWELISESTHPLAYLWGVNSEGRFRFSDFKDAKLSDLFFLKAKDTFFRDDFLAGFYFQNPRPGDVIRFSSSGQSPVVGYPDYVIPDPADFSPVVPFSLEWLAGRMNESSHLAVSKFSYSVVDGRVHGSAREFSKESYMIIDYVNDSLTSPGINGDRYTFYEPIWAYSDVAIDRFKSNYPIADPELLFTVAPFKDITSGAAENIDYWINNNYMEFKDGVQQGYIASVLDGNYFAMKDIKIFSSSFVVPKFLPVFIAVNNVQSKRDVVWELYDEVNGRVYVKIKEVPFLFWRFKDVGRYTLRVSVTDNNNNTFSTEIKNFVNVYGASDYKRYAEGRMEQRKLDILK